MNNYQDNDRHLDMMKAALPYLPAASQQAVTSIIRLSEVLHTLQRLDREEEELLSSCSVEEGEKEMGLLQVIRSFCSPREQEMLDMFMNLNQVMRMYREIETDDSQKSN